MSVFIRDFSAFLCVLNTKFIVHILAPWWAFKCCLEVRIVLISELI